MAQAGMKPDGSALKNPESTTGTTEKKGDPAAEGTEGQTTTDGAAAPDGKKPEPAATSAADRAKQITATRALRRDGWTDKSIAALPADMLLEEGARRASAQAKLDARMETLKANGQAPTREPLADDDSGSTDEPTTEDDGTQPTDLDELLEEIADPDRAEKVKAQVSQAEKRAQQAEARLVTANIGTARELLGSEFPKLKNQGDFEKVIKYMDRLDPGYTLAGDRAAVRELMRDACFVVFGPDIKAQASKNAIATANRQLDGQPDAATDNAQPSKRLTDDEIERAAFEAATTTTSREESLKEFQRRTGKASR
jgi:hypothetical protein